MVIDKNEVKQYCNIYYDDDDNIISLLIKTAEIIILNKTGMSITDIPLHLEETYKSVLFSTIYDLYLHKGSKINQKDAVLYDNPIIDDLITILFYEHKLSAEGDNIV